MPSNDTWMRKRFRVTDVLHGQAATRVLSQLRKSRPPHEYPAILSAFRTAAPKASRSLFALGPSSTSELVWIREALEPLSLVNELLWAEYWLAGHSARINVFRRLALQLQTLLLAGDLSTAVNALDDYVRITGWSLWAVELRAAMLQLAEGATSQRAWLTELQSRTINSIPGLLFQIFSDRNDDTFSYDAIYWKCMNSFPRFDALAPWLVDYLKFRALLHVEDPRKALPGVLSRDITSSLIDYYEDVIEVVAHVESDSGLEDLRPAALRLVTTLIDRGYQDHRLHKLKPALSGAFPSEININTEPVTGFSTVYLKDTEVFASPFLKEVTADLVHCRDEGAASYEVVDKLLKWGINLKGLDVGPAVAMSALHATSRILLDRVLPLSVALFTEQLCVDDAAALTPGAGRSLLLTYLMQTRSAIEVDGDNLYRPRSWRWEERLPQVGPIHLWLALQLLDRQAFDELDEVLEFLRNKGLYWERQCDKIEVVALSKRDRVAEAVKLMEVWFRKDKRYALEFPCDVLFADRKWTSVKDLDPVEVGLVSHYAFEATGNTYVGYVCRMACRRFLQTGMRDSVDDTFAHASDTRRAQLIAFLRDVWIEQNLAMCHQFESTAHIRVERMSVLQLLLSWENERATEYAEAIKDLTFEQTLQQGLECIDQTRVFVNESAISRWAEKELLQDFERWKKLSESNLGGCVVDGLLRQYVLDPTNIEVLKEFADGKPTAADALLIDVIDRLFKRFLLDPTDGLDTYLSVRIRHGSLRGTILGPLEEQGLLYSATGFSQEAFTARWDNALSLPPAEKAELLDAMQEFSMDVRALVDDFVDQQVQIARPEKPNGAFNQVISPLFAKVLSASLAERPPFFQAFLCSGYFIFWKLIEVGLDQLRANIGEQLAEALRSRVDTLIQYLRARGARYLPLITTLTTVSTTTKSQCDTVAEWFRLPGMISGERYQLADAIEIASAATKNIHRSFPADVQVRCLPAEPLPLTTTALAVLMDCLFVFFENAWKHSGFGNELPPVAILAEFDKASNLLSFEARSDLSQARLDQLMGGELSRLRAKYLGELPLELISLEGGSGFPKLARLTRSVPREKCPQPFDFGVDDGQWFTRLSVPLYEREGAFEAYE